MLTGEQIAKYQSIYKKSFGREISKEEAYEQGSKLIRLIELIYKPIKESDYQLLQKRRTETEEL